MIYTIIIAAFVLIVLAQFAVGLGTQNQPVRVVIKNTGATTIQRGHVVEWDSVAASNPVGESLGNIAAEGLILPVIIGTVADTDVDNFPYIGVATERLAQNEVGYACMLGTIPVIANAAQTVGDVIAPAAAGEVLNAASASHAQAIGIMLEAVSAADATANTPRRAFVNFLSPFGRPSGAVVWMGKAY